MVGEREILIEALSSSAGDLLMGDLSKRFASFAGEVAVKLLGQPTYRTSTQLRWGRKGSFVVNIAGPRQGRFHSFETGQDGDLVDLVRWIHGVAYRDALTFLRDLERSGLPQRSMQAAIARTVSPGQRWSGKAQQIWNSATSLAGTMGEAYLRTRRCYVPEAQDLRFLAARERLPSLVARVTDLHTDEPMSLHFIRLDPGTQYKVGGLARPNLANHAIAGGVVRLTRATDCRAALGLAEGIETALSVIAGGRGPVWATVGANLSGLEPLSGVRNINVWADNDEAGIKAAETFADRWALAGHAVRILMPEEPGSDWNDAVRREGSGQDR